MKVEMTKDTKNPLLRRRQVKFSVTHKKSSTPSKLDVAEQLAAKLNADINLMVIEGYTTHFGSNISSGICFIYEDKVAMDKAEPHNTLNVGKRVGGDRKEEVKEEPKEAEEKPKEAGENNETQSDKKE